MNRMTDERIVKLRSVAYSRLGVEDAKQMHELVDALIAERRVLAKVIEAGNVVFTALQWAPDFDGVCKTWRSAVEEATR